MTSTLLTTGLVFALACLGHLVLMITSHNWWYGMPFPKKVGDGVHLAHAFVVAAFPVALWLLAGLQFPELLEFRTGSLWRWLLTAYLYLCLAAALVGLPIDTARRLLRPAPRALVATQAYVIDFAKQLGSPPMGNGKRAWLTRLPWNDVFQVQFNELTVRLPRVPPAWDGLSILHLSDLHICGTPDRDFFRALMDRCADLEPDILCLTGDIIDGYQYQRMILPHLGRLRWNLSAFAILGNHDYWYDPTFIIRRLKKVGFNYLANGWQELNIRNERLIAVGNESPWRRPQPDLTGCASGPFRLCLSHTPDNIAWARRHHIDLMLAGHVHGGQVRIPVFGSLLVPSHYGRRFDCGTFQIGPTLLHVSRGISGEHPVRFRCKPEVTKIVLKSESS